MIGRDGIINAAVVCAVACALTTTGLAVHHEFASSRSTAESSPKPVRDWNGLVTTGHRVGNPSARLTIVEFADFQCPACREFELGTIRAIEKAYPDQVAVIYHHWTMSYHKYAIAAAIAAECSASAGQFPRMRDVLFEKQDSFGIKPFASYGLDAGVSDSAAYAHCLASDQPSKAIALDRKLGNALGISATPTVMIAGFAYPEPPDSAKLDSLLHRAGSR